MIEALIDYGLFAAKALTVLVAIALVLLILLRARQGSEPEANGNRLEIVYLNEHYRSMAQALKKASLQKKPLQKALKAERKSAKQRDKTDEARQRIFVLDFHGDIKASEVSALREIISALLLEASEQDEVLVRLENPGGTVHEHGLAASQLLRIRARGIPLTVAVDKVAASGGYLMAAVANRILAAPFAIIGSIGVLAEIPNFHRWLEQKGIDFELHTAGDYKRTLTLFGENTDAGREKLREQLDQIHAQFKDFITDYRPAVDIARVATGEYWYGEQARELGLVDDIRTSDDYLLANQETADLYKVGYQIKKKPLERLLATMQSSWAKLWQRPHLPV